MNTSETTIDNASEATTDKGKVAKVANRAKANAAALSNASECTTDKAKAKGKVAKVGTVKLSPEWAARVAMVKNDTIGDTRETRGNQGEWCRKVKREYAKASKDTSYAMDRSMAMFLDGVNGADRSLAIKAVTAFYVKVQGKVWDLDIPQDVKAILTSKKAAPSLVAEIAKRSDIAKIDETMAHSATAEKACGGAKGVARLRAAFRSTNRALIAIKAMQSAQAGK